uniref:Uncharacterized protein n=1 Tax=Anguilla anguilla TaxID=7936 RepID=A0A0E9UHB1_ANGAN
MLLSCSLTPKESGVDCQYDPRLLGRLMRW